MFDYQSEKIIPVVKVPDLLPSRPHISTVWRWINCGIGGKKLETFRIGGKRYTSSEAIHRFVKALTLAGDDKTSVSSIQSLHLKAKQRAEQELDDEGL